MAEKGWDATGLLKPLWARVGGRDALAALAGITPPQTLSAYNSGTRQLGLANGRKLAEALGVSLLELGAPANLADGADDGILARLEAIADGVERLERGMARLLKAQPPAAARSPRAAPKRNST